MIVTLAIKKGVGYANVIDLLNNAGYKIINGYTDRETDDFIIEYEAID